MNDIWWDIWEIGVNCIENGALFYLLCSRLERPRNQHWRVWVGYVCLTSLMTALNYSRIGVVGTMVVLSFAQLACCFFCFSASPTKRLFWFLVTAAVPYITNTVIEIFFTLTDYDLQESLHPTQSRLIAQIFYLVPPT